MMYQYYLWGALIVVFAVLELATPGSLISVWFVVGSIIALISAYFGASFILQMIHFFAVSLLLLFATKPLAKKLHKTMPQRLASDRVIGKNGIILKDSDPATQYTTIKVDGTIWRCQSASNSPLTRGELAKVLRISGNTLIVEELDQLRYTV